MLALALLAAAVPATAADCAFVATAGLAAITVVDIGRDRLTGFLPVGERPSDVPVSPSTAAPGRRISRLFTHLTVSVLNHPPRANI